MYGGSSTTRIGKVLLLDHCPDARATVRERLEADGYEVVEAASRDTGLQALDLGVDAVVLELHLAGTDGFTVLREIRERSDIPVLMTSTIDDETDRVIALEMGADDMVVKPFSVRELVARVRALLRRASITAASQRPVLRQGPVVVDTAARTASAYGTPLSLTPKTFDLLAFFVANPGRTFTREELLQQVWQSEPEWQNAATVTEHVHRLRRQVEPSPDTPVHLVTVRGNGYRFDA